MERKATMFRTARSLHTEAGVAASIKAGGAHDYRVAVVALSVGSMLALGSLSSRENNPQEDAALIASRREPEQKMQQSRRQAPLIVTDPAAASKNQSLTAQTATACEPQRTTTKPRNAMINARKSMKGRGLYDKYKVDWDTVLGEGAYGTVHPARLAATGEKVRMM